MPKVRTELLEEDILQEARRMSQVFDINELQHKFNQMYLTYQMLSKEEGSEDLSSEMYYLNELLRAVSKLNK
jgi:hypothetical protein